MFIYAHTWAITRDAGTSELTPREYIYTLFRKINPTPCYIDVTSPAIGLLVSIWFAAGLLSRGCHLFQ